MIVLGIQSIFDGTEIWLSDIGLTKAYIDFTIGQFLIGKGQSLKDKFGWSLNCTKSSK